MYDNMKNRKKIQKAQRRGRQYQEDRKQEQKDRHDAQINGEEEKSRKRSERP